MKVATHLAAALTATFASVASLTLAVAPAWQDGGASEQRAAVESRPAVSQQDAPPAGATVVQLPRVVITVPRAPVPAASAVARVAQAESAAWAR